MTIQFGISKN